MPMLLAAAVLAAGSRLWVSRLEEMAAGWELGDRKNQAVLACFGFLWNGHYPAGREESRSEPGVLELVLRAMPAYRLGKEKEEEKKGGSGRDPAFSEYLKNRIFYETYGSTEEEPAGELSSREPAEPASVTGLPQGGKVYSMEQLADYDFLMRTFYNVHPSTTAGRDEMDAKELLSRDLRLEKNGEQPQILIYHSHSQETYSDYGPENQEATVVGVGNYLTELLEKKGYQVIHDTSVYDLRDGKLDRSQAYTYALEGITGILQENPSIEVVLDIHRDGVDENTRLTAEVGGKTAASIMFFNGMSQTPEGPIEYLPNPYREDNLAFSLQMQMKAAAYFPGLTRKIYLKGLRYNLHVRPRSALIEVGAQNNTYEEARNAMEPLAEVLDMVLQGN